MQVRKISGKAVSHPRRELRRLRAQLRAVNDLDASGRELSVRVEALETKLRAPQGGRRHGGRRHVR